MKEKVLGGISLYSIRSYSGMAKNGICLLLRPFANLCVLRASVLKK
jgi:hypothetical protein